MNTINFFFEDVPGLPIINDDLKCKIHKVASLENYKVLSINFIFCSDEYLYTINQQYLNHSYYTDIITFNISESPLVLSGDIFISMDRVSENATIYTASISNELLRIMIHGVLHLIGYDDKSEDLKTIMTQKEDFYLAKFAF